MRWVLLLAVLLVGCDTPTAPERMDGEWGIEGVAGTCDVSGVLRVAGEALDFTATGPLRIGSDPERVVVMRGSGGTLYGGGLELRIDTRQANLLRGAWECEGAPGVWEMWRYR